MKPSVTLGIALLAAVAVTAHSAETVRYVALVNGGAANAGHQWVTREDDGTTKVDFDFKDNGRGPTLKEEYKLAADGTFLSYHVTGTSEIGAPVDETFSRDGDKARWKSTSDKGEQTVQGTALYTPLGGTMQGLSVAYAALARRVDGKLPLIPSGTLSYRKLADAEVSNGKATRQVQLVAVTGIGFTPTTAWMTKDASPRLFAFIYPGFL